MKTYDERMASVQQKLQHKQVRRRVLMATAGVLCLCIVAGLVFPFFENRNNIDRYTDSDYYKVMEAIKRDLPGYIGGSQFEEWMDMEMIPNGGVMLDGVVPEASDKLESPVEPGASNAPTMKPNEESDSNASVEITDHQVEGVWEADIIKRSKTHIFYLKGTSLEVYPIAGEETELLSTWKLDCKENQAAGTIPYRQVEMYLSADATRLNLIASGYADVFGKGMASAFVQVVSLDVTDPANIREANSVYFTGSLLSTRMVEEQMLLVFQYQMDSKINFEDESTFLPQMDSAGNMQSVPAENIIIPDKLDSRRYTVVALLNSRDMTIQDSGAFMSYSTELYVSKERIYVYRCVGFSEKAINENAYTGTNMSEVSCMSYGADGLETQGTFPLEGTIKNQYSMDEHDGIFRVVTETYRYYRYYHYNKSTNATVDAQGNTEPPSGTDAITSDVFIPGDSRNANLTCFKVGTWEQAAQVAQFAPDGETVESVRFDGDYAYVCTAVVVTLTDPVFFFDMTDLDNIIVKDTGTIDGYSSSLIQLKDGYLMGIGFGEQRRLKVEIYEETEDGVASVCSYENDTQFASAYKAYYIDRENNLFGIPTRVGYVLLQFDGYQLNKLTIAKNEGDLDNVRGVVIEEYLYVFSPKTFDVVKIA